LKKKNSEAAQPDSFLNTCSILLILKEIVGNLKNDKSSNKNLATDPEFFKVSKQLSLAGCSSIYVPYISEKKN
jgi:hypothetical protein